MWPLSESFGDKLGRWNGFAPWDNTIFFDGIDGFLATQSHVDLRTFRLHEETVPRPQTDLEATAQTRWDAATTQLEMEITAGDSQDTEHWALDPASTGVHTAFSVGKIASRGGWSGLQMVTNGSALSTKLTSSIAGDNLDISAMSKVSLVFPDYQGFTAASSSIQFTSHPNGVFDVANDSAVVPFSSSGSAMPEVLLPVASFANAGFNNAKITGVRIILTQAVAPAANQKITIMALRAVTNTWEESWLDFDTRLGAACVPVTLDGDVYTGIIAQGFEFIRGDGSQNDPIPGDGAFNVYFYPGGGTSPNDASSGNPNVLAVLLREIFDDDAETGSVIVARLHWGDDGAVFECQREDFTGGAGGTRTYTTLHSETISGDNLDPATHFLFRVELVGTQVTGKLYVTDLKKKVGEKFWESIPVTTADFVYRNGRVGFEAGLLSRDAYVFEFEPSVTNFALLRTAAYKSETPVDGARLAASFATDMNLWDSFSGADLFVDATKTTSGNGSFRSSKALSTNAFIVDDWHQTYLGVQVFVGASVTEKNQPKFYLNTPDGEEPIILPKMQANRWNTVLVDLGVFQDLVTGIAYSITIRPGDDPDRALGFYWIDDMLIGRRRVSWSIRATDGGQFREFRGLVNDPFGALHFNPDERGTELQLQAAALTDDAWVSSFKLFPRYAELGAPVYDESANR